MSGPRDRWKHERGRTPFGSLAGIVAGSRRSMGFLLLCLPLACSRIPPGRSAVDSVTIHNAKGVSAGELEGKLATQASPKFLFLFQGVAYDYSVYDEAVLQRDMARLERAYRARGFFDAHARVGAVRQISRKHVVVDIVVDEGTATVNRNVTVVGIEGLPTDVNRAAVVAARTTLARGEHFDEAKFNDSKDAVRKALTDRGYAYASVESDAEVDVGEHVADYGFKVVPGPRATFGPITITGLDPDSGGPRKQEIPEAPLRRAIDIREGSTYSTAEIDSATQALLDLEVFSAVEITPTLPQPPPANAVVPLTVKVEPIRLRQITLGGGIELDEIKTDLHAVAGWEDHNFLGGLRDFEVTFKPGAVLYPVRIDNFNGPVKPLPEERLRMALRQPGLFEARTNGFLRPEFNIFPLLVEVDPPADAPVVGYREAKIPIGLDRTFWNKLYVALDYTFQLENPIFVRRSPRPGTRNRRAVFSGARDPSRFSRRSRSAAQRDLSRKHHSGRGRHLWRDGDRRPNSAGNTNLRAGDAWRDLCDASFGGLSLGIELWEQLEWGARELGQLRPTSRRQSRPDRALSRRASHVLSRVLLGRPHDQSGIPASRRVAARRDPVSQPRNGFSAGEVQL